MDVRFIASFGRVKAYAYNIKKIGGNYVIYGVIHRVHSDNRITTCELPPYQCARTQTSASECLDMIVKDAPNCIKTAIYIEDMRKPKYAREVRSFYDREFKNFHTTIAGRFIKYEYAIDLYLAPMIMGHDESSKGDLRVLTNRERFLIKIKDVIRELFPLEIVPGHNCIPEHGVCAEMEVRDTSHVVEFNDPCDDKISLKTLLFKAMVQLTDTGPAKESSATYITMLVILDPPSNEDNTSLGVVEDWYSTGEEKSS